MPQIHLWSYAGEGGNIVLKAKDMFAAIATLKKRYPDCGILEANDK